MESMNGCTRGEGEMYYRILSIGNSSLGIAYISQIALGVGIEWDLYGVFIRIEIGPLYIWFGRGRNKIWKV